MKKLTPHTAMAKLMTRRFLFSPLSFRHFSCNNLGSQHCDWVSVCYLAYERERQDT
jgi:hypothetical protein